MAQAAGSGNASGKLFNGYDSVGRGMLDTEAVTGQIVPGGGRSTVNIRVCESLSDLAEALEIDGSLSVSYLKAVNVTAKMDFMKKLNVTARSVSIVVYASHETGTWTIKGLNLKEDINPPSDNNEDDQADFVDIYGDSYVSSATEGGEYYAVYTFRTETKSEQSTLAGSLKTNVVVASVKSQLEVQAKLSNFLTETKVNWTFNQQMTGHRNPVLPDPEKIIEFALAFPSKDLDAPVTTGFKVAGYEGVPGIGRKKFGKIKKNRDYFLGNDGALASFARLTALQNQIDWLKRIYARYNYTGDTELLTFETHVRQDLAKINAQIAAYKDNPADSFAKPDLPSLAKGEPVLTYVVGQSPEYGYIGGAPFGIGSVGEALRNQVRLKTVTLGVRDNNLARLRLEYASEGKETLKQEHGHGGVDTHPLAIEEGQFPVKFDIYWYHQVQRLEVHLSDGRSVAGGNSHDAKHTTWHVPEGYVLLGLAGKAGSIIHEISFVHAKLQPAEYKKTI